MAVEIMSYRSNGSNAAQEAANCGLQTVEKLIAIFSHQTQHQSPYPHGGIDDHALITDSAVTEFKKIVSSLDRTRTGHARFRKGPLPKTRETELSGRIELDSISTVSCPTPLHSLPPVPQNQYSVLKQGAVEWKESTATIDFSETNSFISSVTMSPGFQITNPSTVTSASRQPVSSQALKRKCASTDEPLNLKSTSSKCGGSSENCHCPKKRKSKVKRVVRVPAVSMKLADIPQDDFSWRKYGQKAIKGSPHPRGYYRCSSVKGCPAHKHVERALDDPTMLIITYENEHNHSCTGTGGSISTAAHVSIHSDHHPTVQPSF
ncbi:probable WRKY transcription factor 7 [Rhododendron vialii]|uniref:probable WRKY transcription factor 7 n=1 Tax=Rhododendron vialii TaxID=182163 RepID=UPI00265FA6C3|nr:probable WRKY transcription factor 7 [Rhododendron vialii]